MKVLLISLMSLFGSATTLAQINNSVILWLKADAGTTPAAPVDGNNITGWTTQQGSYSPTVSATRPTYCMPATTAATSVQNFFNYNPSFTFNGAYLSFNTNLVNTLTAARIVYVTKMTDTTGGNNTFASPFSELHNMGGGCTKTTADVRIASPFPLNTASYSGKYMGDDFGAIGNPNTGTMPAGTSAGQVFFGKGALCSEVATATEMDIPFIYSSSNEANGTDSWRSRMLVNNRLMREAVTNTANFDVGHRTPNYYFPTTPNVMIFNGDGSAGGFNARTYRNNCAEIIMLNADVTTDELSNLHSYLAVKYGITISQQTIGKVLSPVNYTSSTSTTDKWTGAGTVIWNASLNTDYRYNIIGIGHDALATPLVNQRQSKSVNRSNKGNLLSISTQALAATNAANTTAVSATGNSFFMVADNNMAAHSGGPTGSGTTGTNPEANTELPAGVYSRIHREWLSQATNFSQNVTIGFDGSLLGNDTPISNLRLLTDADGDFSNATIESMLPVANAAYPDIIEFTVTSAMYAARPYFTLASISSSTTLPVGLVSFVADCENEEVVLKWDVASETSNKHFTLEGSNDAVNYKKISDVAGRGTTDIPKVYHYKAGPVRYKYYRLSQTDSDGTTAVLRVAAASCDIPAFSVELYPNPLSENEDELNFNIASGRSERITVQFYDMTGKLCQEESIAVLKGNGAYQVNAANLSKGMYTIRISGITDDVPAMKFIRN